MNILKKAKNNVCQAPTYGKLSYSQSGEDLIVKFLLDTVGIIVPTYIDVGAHHPQYINNTTIFYESGSTGVNIEPDPELFKLFKTIRKNDTNINIGVAAGEKTLDFYVLSTPTLNTFSKEEVKKYKSEGYHVERVIKVKTLSINKIIKKYFNKAPDFMNLDAEGMNLEILKSLDFDIYSPNVICVETISFSLTGTGKKDHKLIKYLKTKGYLLYADTYINSIFVKKTLWVR